MVPEVMPQQDGGKQRFLFDGLWLRREQGRIEIRYPAAVHPVERALQAGAPLGVDIRRDGDAWRVTCPDAGVECPDVLKRFFARLNGCPDPYPHPRAAPPSSTAADPLVSCIVLVNENALFVQEQLLPSLAAHAGSAALDVVLVSNGAGSRVTANLPCRTVEAPWGAVAAGYNVGARAARGQYLAFLHDDVVIDDPRWIDKCLAALAQGATAAAAEYRQMADIAGVTIPGLLVAKCVPLLIGRDAFFEAGGYDEFHYVGYEDLDFTLALLERGRKLAAVDIRSRHYGGMSTTLKYCPVPGLAALHAMTALPTGAIRQAFREYTAGRAQAEPGELMGLALDVQKLYVLKKYSRLLAALDADAHARAVSALERRITTHATCDPHLILPRFRATDRAAASAVAGVA